MTSYSVLLFLFLLPGKEIVVDLENFKWSAYYNDVLIKEGPASGGRKWCSDIKRSCRTPIGTFVALTKRNKWYRSPLYPIGCGTDKPCAPMPYAVKFKYDGASIHSSNDDWSNLKHRSHGCVHVVSDDAKWINEFVDIGKTRITVLKY